MSEQENIRRLNKALSESDPWDEAIAYISVLEKKIDAVEKDIVEIKRGFPAHHKSGEREPRYHADWHERDIEDHLNRKELTKHLFTALLASLVLTICAGVWYLIQTGVKVEVNRAVEVGKK